MIWYAYIIGYENDILVVYMKTMFRKFNAIWVLCFDRRKSWREKQLKILLIKYFIRFKSENEHQVLTNLLLHHQTQTIKQAMRVENERQSFHIDETRLYIFYFHRYDFSVFSFDFWSQFHFNWVKICILLTPFTSFFIE